MKKHTRLHIMANIINEKEYNSLNRLTYDLFSDLQQDFKIEQADNYMFAKCLRIML